MSTRMQDRTPPRDRARHEAWAERVRENSGPRWGRPGRICEGCMMPEYEILAAGGNLEAHHDLPFGEYTDDEHRYNNPEGNGHALCYFERGDHPQGRGKGGGCHSAVDPYRATYSSSPASRRRHEREARWERRNRSLWRALPQWRHPHLRMFGSLIVAAFVVTSICTSLHWPFPGAFVGGGVDRLNVMLNEFLFQIAATPVLVYLMRITWRIGKRQRTVRYGKEFR
jgi:hypothetical protein